MAKHLAGCDTRGGWICAAGCPVAAAQRAEQPTALAPPELSVELVDRFLVQLALDRNVGYWQGEPHGPTLDAAATWLESLRDHLANIR